MSLTKWMTLAAAVVVLGVLGGGVGVAARQLGSGPADQEVKAQPPQSTANPARKALKEAQEGINAYESQLKAAQVRIEQQHSDILALKARIAVLESRVDADGTRGTNQPTETRTSRPTSGAATGTGALATTSLFPIRSPRSAPDRL